MNFGLSFFAALKAHQRGGRRRLVVSGDSGTGPEQLIAAHLLLHALAKSSSIALGPKWRQHQWCLRSLLRTTLLSRARHP